MEELVPTTDFTSTIHRTVYEAISPARQELSQSGKTIFITGGATGIGKAIAQSFITASAAIVIIVARRVNVLQDAATELEAYAKDIASPTKIITRTCDVTDLTQVAAIWDNLSSNGITVDVLVSNAASFTEPKTLFELGTDEIWNQFDTNVKGPLYLAQRFFKQPGQDLRFLVNVSTQSIHMHQHPIVLARPCYSLTKASGTLAYQLLADTITPDRMQIISFHPGLIYSEGWASSGITKDMLPFDELDLPGAFAVWAASKEASFLHGRFVWASWDVTELEKGEVGKRIEEDPGYLKVGVIGIKGRNRA